MKKTVYICNRCGHEIRTQGTRIIPHFFETKAGKALEDVTVPEDDRHFCLDCTKDIMDGLTGLLDPATDPDAKPKAERQEEISDSGESKPSKRVRLDGGKVMALQRAGWDNAAIACEMRATERQIYQCIRYMKKRRMKERMVKMSRNYKKLSSHGSINIPAAMRREIGLQGGDPMEVSLDEGKITVTPYTPRCIFCEGTEDTHPFEGRYICGACAQRALEILKGVKGQ